MPFSWADHLPEVMYNMYTCLHSCTKTTPYHIVFRQPPNNGMGKKFVEESYQNLGEYEEIVQDFETDDSDNSSDNSSGA